MPKVEFRAEINLGQMITMGTMLLAAGVAWGSVTAIQNAHASEINSIRSEVAGIAVDRLTTENRLTRIETLIETQGDKIDRVLSAVSATD